MIDTLFGNAGEVEVKHLQSELAPLLIDGETAVKAFRFVRDYFVFTDKRLLLVDKQGFSGKKAEYQSIPYRSITHFAIESSGSFDRDAEIKLWITGGHFLEKEIKKGINVLELQKILATYVCGK